MRNDKVKKTYRNLINWNYTVNNSYQSGFPRQQTFLPFYQKWLDMMPGYYHKIEYMFLSLFCLSLFTNRVQAYVWLFIFLVWLFIPHTINHKCPVSHFPCHQMLRESASNTKGNDKAEHVNQTQNYNFWNTEPTQIWRITNWAQIVTCGVKSRGKFPGYLSV